MIPIGRKRRDFRDLTEPMGGFRKCYISDYGRNSKLRRIITWHPDYSRLRRLKKRVQGPLQKEHWKRKHDQTRRLVLPSERHVIKKVINSQGQVVKIYDTDKERVIDRVYNPYTSFHFDMWDMEDIITERKVPKEKYGEELLKRIYEDLDF